MNRVLVAAVVVFLNLIMLSAPAQAQAGPPVNPSLKEAVTLIPIPGIKDAVNSLFGSLKQVGGGGEYMAKVTVPVPGLGDVPLQLYFFGTADKQAILLVVNRTIAMPGVFNNSAWKKLAGTTVTDAIFSFSTVDFSLDVKDMPAEFKQIVANSYFNVDSLDFSNGFQVASRASIGGIMKNIIEFEMGVPVQNFTMRAGVVLPVPTDAAGGAALAANVLADMKNVEKMAKESPEFFAEFQLAPGKTINSPMGMNGMVLSDATFSLNNKGTVGYKGNVILPNIPGKKFITFFETVLSPAGAMDLLDFKFGLAAQSLTLEEYINAGFAFTTPKVPGGNFVKDIVKFKDQLLIVTKPLSVFQLRNPKPVPEYKFGDKSKPFPPLEAFNILLLGPLASAEDSTGKSIKGPFLKVVGNARILGQEVGSMNVMLGSSGLHGKVSAGLSLKMGPLGKQSIKMDANADIGADKQVLGMHGNILGRILDMNMSPSHLTVNSPATCLTPFALSMNVAIDPNINVASLLDSLPGVNVDPSQLAGCFGEDLKKALNWVSTTGSSLGGYSAKAANEALNKIGKDAEEEYNKAKNAARDAAGQVSNDAMRVFNDAGNVFKGIGKKKKHKGKPDARFDRSVFNWDFYYDKYPDLVRAKVNLVTHWRDYGFQEGRQGSLEFSAKYYLDHYPDLQKNLGDFDGVLWQWVNYGIAEGRQGSPDFSVKAYLARYPDLQKAFGKDNYEAAFDHWMESGKSEGRNGRP